MKHTHRYALMYGLVMGLGFLSTGITQAKLDPMVNKNKNMFLKAVEDQRWDDAQGLFALISGQLKELLDASPALSAALQNAARDAVEGDDLDTAKIIMKWVAQFPPKSVDVLATSSTLQNRVRDAIEADDLERAKKLMELVALLPDSINVLATSSMLQNRLKNELEKPNFGSAPNMMALIGLLPSGTNVLATSSTLQNMLQEAIEQDDSKAARMIASLLPYLPKDTNATATIALLTHTLQDALDEQDSTKVAFLAFVGQRLPANAKQEFMEKWFLAELVRRIGSALKDKNWDDVVILGKLFNAYKQRATSVSGKKTVQNGKKYLRLAHSRAMEDKDMDAAEKLKAIQ